MAIWAELKKVVNSNFNKPLNELITEGFNGVGAVKNVQRGRIAMSAKALDVTIYSVNMSKTMINVQVYGTHEDNNSVGGDSFAVTGRLISSTKLRLYTNSTHTGVYMLWEVIEFK